MCLIRMGESQFIKHKRDKGDKICANGSNSSQRGCVSCQVVIGSRITVKSLIAFEIFFNLIAVGHIHINTFLLREEKDMNVKLKFLMISLSVTRQLNAETKFSR